MIQTHRRELLCSHRFARQKLSSTRPQGKFDNYCACSEPIRLGDPLQKDAPTSPINAPLEYLLLRETNSITYAVV